MKNIYFQSNWWSWKKNHGSWPVPSMLWTWIFLHVISSLGLVFCFFNLLAKAKAREWQIIGFKIIINLIITIFSREIILMKVTLVFYVQSAVPEKCNWTAFSFKNMGMCLYLVLHCYCQLSIWWLATEKRPSQRCTAEGRDTGHNCSKGHSDCIHGKKRAELELPGH